MSTHRDRLDALYKFATALLILTKCGTAEWAREADDPGHVWCFLPGERIKFDLTAGARSKRNRKPIRHPKTLDDVYGIAANYRNTHLLWLPTLPGFDDLGAHLLSIRINDRRFRKLCRESYFALLDDVIRESKRRALRAKRAEIIG